MAPHLVVAVAVVLFVAYMGYALGKSDLRIRPVPAAATGVVAVIVHGIWQLALPHRGIDWIGTAVDPSLESPTWVALATVETAGFWVPALVIPWGALRTRIWAAAYIIGAGTLGVVAYYAPTFDPLQEGHPNYELWLVLAFAFAAVPFAIGCFAKTKPRTVAHPDARAGRAGR